jgi:prepilin-type N-terminal cleavage/methylation domain-containing protein/prepilin-type processing-associated H-X9-DG protein
MVLISTYIGLIVFELRKPSPKPCGCLMLDRFIAPTKSAKGALLGSIGLNLLLGGTFVVAFLQASPDYQSGSVDRSTASHPGAQGTKARAGFSAPEVLVVVAIISILLALLIPVVGRARAESQRILCASNLHALGQGFIAYANDNGGSIPRGAVSSSPKYPVWPVVMLKYVGVNHQIRWDQMPSVKSLQCPTHPETGIPTGFVVNAFAFDRTPRWRQSPAIQLSRIRNPSTLPLILEASDRFGVFENPVFDDIFFESAHVIYDPAHLNGPRVRISSARHVGRASNVLFADSHVEARRGSSFKLEDFDDRLAGR